jgi:hypothetical protein
MKDRILHVILPTVLVAAFWVFLLTYALMSGGTEAEEAAYTIVTETYTEDGRYGPVTITTDVVYGISDRPISLLSTVSCPRYNWMLKNGEDDN